MDLKLSTTGTCAQFVISGHIDESGAAQLKEHFRSLDLTQTKEVVLDFSNVSHIGSAGIGKLLLFYKDLAINGGSIRIENPSTAIRQLFMELNLHTLFTIV